MESNYDNKNYRIYIKGNPEEIKLLISCLDQVIPGSHMMDGLGQSLEKLTKGKKVAPTPLNYTNVRIILDLGELSFQMRENQEASWTMWYEHVKKAKELYDEKKKFGTIDYDIYENPKRIRIKESNIELLKLLLNRLDEEFLGGIISSQYKKKLDNLEEVVEDIRVATPNDSISFSKKGILYGPHGTYAKTDELWKKRKDEVIKTLKSIEEKTSA